MEAPPPPPPPPPQNIPVKQSFLRRNKYILPLLLTVNVSAGAYLLLKPKEKATDAEKSTAPVSLTAPTSTASPQIEATPTISKPVKPHDPIPIDQQRELFKWILEEKRKTKAKDRAEKKHIDEEKAILKQFIHSTSIPTI